MYLSINHRRFALASILMLWLLPIAAPAPAVAASNGFTQEQTSNDSCMAGGDCFPADGRGLTPESAGPRPLVVAGLLDDLAPSRSTEKPGGDAANPFLPPDQAFVLSVDVQKNGAIRAHWTIADGYYLYRDKFKFAVDNQSDTRLEAARIPRGKTKHDETFGDTEVFYHKVDISVPYVRPTPGNMNVMVAITYQGCADAGFCYPPITKQVNLELQEAQPSVGTITGNFAAPSASEQDRIAQSLFGASLLTTVASFFGFGLLLAFTPCVFPMVPILSGIIVGQADQINTRRAFRLTLVYVLAMAVTYTLAGIAAGKFGQNLQAAFQNPWVISAFSLLFVALALSMFGLYELQLPQRLQTRISELSNHQRSGSYAGVAVMGLLSALIVGPCIAAPLAGALIYIGQSGDAVRGGIALFSLSMGMGLPLMIIGTSAGKLLPRAGPWMVAIKAICGVILLGVAIWLLARIVAPAVTMFLWSVLLMICSVYMGVFNRLQDAASGWQKLRKGASVVLFVYGTLIMVGASTGGTDVLRPLENAAFMAEKSGESRPQFAAKPAFQRVKGLEQLNREIQHAASLGKPVMLDFYADWCVSCKELEAKTFSDSGVLALLDKFVVLQADVTENDASDQELLKSFGLFGPPSILFFSRDGEENPRMRLVGFIDTDAFRSHLQTALKL